MTMEFDISSFRYGKILSAATQQDFLLLFFKVNQTDPTTERRDLQLLIFNLSLGFMDKFNLGETPRTSSGLIPSNFRRKQDSLSTPDKWKRLPKQPPQEMVGSYL